jgi:peptidoglycan/xylan/chitin deacetylase (PgdA/CDA1 family)
MQGYDCNCDLRHKFLRGDRGTDATNHNSGPSLLPSLVIKQNPNLVAPPSVPFLRSAKRFALKVANRTGMSSAVGASKWRQQRLLVLCYHGISQLDEHEWSDLYISPERFEQRLEMLRKIGATVLPLDQAVEGLYAGDLPQKAVCVTFDDGACDFAIKAVPLLTTAQVHSTVYLTTYYCSRPMPVFAPFLSYLLWKGRGRTVLLPGINSRVTIPAYVELPAFNTLHRSLLAHVQNAGLDAVEKHEFARLVARATGADFEELNARRIMHLMNPDELRALDPDLISIQLHTHRHMTPASLDELREELDRNAQEISRMSGRTDALHHFCYPSGRYTPEFMNWLRMLGIRSATTCAPDYSTSDTSPMAIPRFVDTMAVTPDSFSAWVTGAAAFTLRR